MEGMTEELTDAQRKALIQLKANVEDILTPDYTDSTLIKWLKVKSFDVKGAEKIFRENYYNRILHRIDTLLDTYEKHEIAKQYEATGVIGFAKDGSLIRYTAIARIDFYGFIMSMSCFEIAHYFCYSLESDIRAMKKESLRTGKNVDEVTYIFDLDQFQIQQILHRNVIEICLDLLRLAQDCYPDIWRHILIVNAPAIFDKAFSIFKPVCRATILEKFRVVNKDCTKDLLLQYIDEDILPAFLGGKRVDSNGDIMCKDFLTFGGKVPDKFYSQNQSTFLSPDDPGVKCVVIRQRSTYNHSVVVKDGGTVAKLQVRSENGSLAFSVFHKELEEDSNNPEFPGENEYLDENVENCKYKMVSVSIRPQLHCTPTDIELFLQWPGIYVFRFSNAGNWFTSRNLLIRITLNPPKSESTTLRG